MKGSHEPRSDEPRQQSRPGRRRSEQARQAILAAALELLAEEGLAGLTMEAIAAKAGVGKTTIYRWWPSRGAVALDGLLDASEEQSPFDEGGELRDAFRAQVRSLTRFYLHTAKGRAVAAIIGAAQSDPDLAVAFRERFLLKRRAQGAGAIVAGQRRGEIRTDVDPDLALDLIYAPIYYRLLIGHAPLSERYAEQIVDTALDGLRPR
jgi:AcrR family transcriptional regulator